MVEKNSYNKIAQDINSDEIIKELSKPGLCRKWTALAINFVKNNFPDVETEAREVEISPNLQHTFLQIRKSNNDPYIFDGTGVEKHSPYSGYEKDVPIHLQNSKPDMINKYIE